MCVVCFLVSFCVLYVFFLLYFLVGEFLRHIAVQRRNGQKDTRWLIRRRVCQPFRSTRYFFAMCVRIGYGVEAGNDSCWGFSLSDPPIYIFLLACTVVILNDFGFHCSVFSSVPSFFISALFYFLCHKSKTPALYSVGHHSIPSELSLGSGIVIVALRLSLLNTAAVPKQAWLVCAGVVEKLSIQYSSNTCRSCVD